MEVNSESKTLNNCGCVGISPGRTLGINPREQNEAPQVLLLISSEKTRLNSPSYLIPEPADEDLR